jgi:hypothetical protein
MELSMKPKPYFIALLFTVLVPQLGQAQEPWRFGLAYESPVLTKDIFFMATSADVNRNGIPEVILTDFGFAAAGLYDEQDPYENLFVLEWEKNELKVKFNKKWDPSKVKGSDEAVARYFSAWKATRFMIWPIGDRVVAETIAPYLGLEWSKGGYVLHEQHGWAPEVPLVGSWALQMLSASCYPDFRNRATYPRECLVGVRDFSGNGKPKIVTLLEEELVKDKQYKQTLRVRKFEPGFPIEWEMVSSKRFGRVDSIDRLNMSARQGLIMREFKTTSTYLFEPQESGKGYRLRLTQIKEPMDLEPYALSDVYLRTTQKKGVEEYWGYHSAQAPDEGFILLLRKVILKPDLTGFTRDDIDFPHHEPFLGMGFFDLKDLDGDGLDEVILVEQTGKREFTDEHVRFSEVKDYIRILKWNGKKYQTMWVSPPYTKRGARFLVEDIKNIGKKQMVVMTPEGTVQIWEKQ